MSDLVKTKNKLVSDFLKNHKWTLLLLLLLGSLFYAYMQRIPLPDDEELIANFRAHRTDIEEVVRRYRAFDPGGDQSHHLWVSQGDTQGVMQQAGVSSVSDTTLGLWFPDPYAPEHDKKTQSLVGLESLRLHHQIGVLRISIADSRYRQVSLRHGGVIWKDLLFFPEVPRIENERLIGPTYHGRPQYRLLVLSSLDERPSAWRSVSVDECVLRQFEPNWFIRLCRSH